MTESFQSHVEETNELSDALALLCYVDFFNVFKNFIFLIITWMTKHKCLDLIERILNAKIVFILMSELRKKRIGNLNHHNWMLAHQSEIVDDLVIDSFFASQKQKYS